MRTDRPIERNRHQMENGRRTDEDVHADPQVAHGYAQIPNLFEREPGHDWRHDQTDHQIGYLKLGNFDGSSKIKWQKTYGKRKNQVVLRPGTKISFEKDCRNDEHVPDHTEQDDHRENGTYGNGRPQPQGKSGLPRGDNPRRFEEVCVSLEDSPSCCAAV
jgi:hypothetical protein